MFAMASMLKRPEETVQQAIISHSPAIFDAIGPQMRDQQSDKAYVRKCSLKQTLFLVILGAVPCRS